MIGIVLVLIMGACVLVSWAVSLAIMGMLYLAKRPGWAIIAGGVMIPGSALFAYFGVPFLFFKLMSLEW